MPIDLSYLPIIDVHCHPYTRKESLTPEQWVDTIAFGGGSAQYLADGGIAVDEAAMVRLHSLKQETLYYRYMLNRLAEHFDCLPRLDEVVEARNAAIASQGYEAYTHGLHRSGNIQTLIMDFGYPVPQVDLATFRAEVGVEVVPLLRIEVVIKELLESERGWPEFAHRFDEEIAEGLTHGGFRGLKSIIAYRTGLDINPSSRTPDQGMIALEKVRRARGRGGNAIKALRDHLFCRALEHCIDHDVPFQVHTGMGDWEVHLTACRPALLQDLLRFPAYRAGRVLLVHTGYPYHAEAGYLANVLPNVWCDISEGLPFAGRGAKRIFAEVLEMAPLSRVCYGSDTYGSPEPFFSSALLGRQMLSQVLEELIADGFLRAVEAPGVARRILADNARELYRLS